MEDLNRREPRSRNGILIAVVVVLLLLLVAWAAGLFDVKASGELEAPKVSVEGGSLPDVDADVADVNVGTKTTTVEVPTVDVDSANANNK